MKLTIERFDLDERVREPNTRRPTPANSALPVDFPFVVDADTEEVVEPIALHLIAKFAGNSAYKGARWTMLNSANAAAADLKAWWTFLGELPSKPSWDKVSDTLLAGYLRALKRAPSQHTGDTLDPQSVKRHCASIDAFHDFARARWPKGVFPSMNAAKTLAGVAGRGGVHWTDETPHPLTRENVLLVNAALGPMPSARRPGQSSRTRLAWALAVQCGLRIDEICNLPAELFRRLDVDPAQPMKSTALEILVTKGMVKRDVVFPHWLVLEVQKYISGEREESLARGRLLWIRSAEDEPLELLLNRPDARARGPGKAATTDTIETDFNEAIVDLKLMKPRHKMAGTVHLEIVDVPRHVFHDGRHTFAHWLFGGMLDRGMTVDAAWMALKTRLGHRHKATTMDVYLKTFSEVPETMVDKLVEHLATLATGANP